MQRSQISGTLAALCIAWLSVSATSRADDSVAACAEAYSKGQEDRLAGRLLDAREEFTLCANTRCPRVVFPDCQRWAGEVEAALVKIVPEARDDAGHEIAAASVSVDGVRLTAEQLRSPFSLEPGNHVVRFEAPGYDPIQVGAELRSGDRAVSVRAVMQRTKRAQLRRPKHKRPRQLEPVSSFPVAAVSIAGVGVLTLIGATYLGVSAANRYDDLKSTCSPRCPPQESDGVHRRAVAADLLLAASAAAFAGAAWLYFRRPSDQGAATALGVRAGVEGAQLELRLAL